MNEEFIAKIKGVCFSQAKSLLEDYNEFFPFAFGLTAKETIVPVMTYFGQESPSSADVIDHLKLALKKSDESNHFECAAICVDVLTTPPYLDEKIDSLEIRIAGRDNKSINYYIPYRRDENNQLAFLEEYQKDSSFYLW